ncbi:MAG TPA: CheR family methyltransferase, partial [Spirochaetia bacterium]|nr:CheR family methyltransferase [Spirochaetia bacterium]
MTEQTMKAERSEPRARWEPKPPTTIEPLSDETFQRFCKLIYEKTNIRMRESKHVLVSNRLRKRIVALDLKGYDEYYDYLSRGEKRAQEMVHFIDAVSTNETYFFREYNHFDALLKLVLPDLSQRKRRLRFWCAGCSTGEEPYTLRIVLEEARAAHRVGEVEILATDISHQVIDRAREGEYGERAVRMVPADLMKRYFIQEREGCYRVSP